MRNIREARRIDSYNERRSSFSADNPYLYRSNRPDILNERIPGILIRKISLSRLSIIGLLLVIGLLAFEVFNFDTTQFALLSLLGEVSFFGFRWATILAVAFGAIDFAGLAYMLAPERAQSEHGEVWYLMGAWLLGATMNALMTWWAVSLTLLSHDLGNEVLGRSDLLHVVPVFVAVLVWLTRILFIGAFSVAGNQIFAMDRSSKGGELGLSGQQRARIGSSERTKEQSPQFPDANEVYDQDDRKREESQSMNEARTERSRSQVPDHSGHSPRRYDRRPAYGRPLPVAASAARSRRLR